MTAWKKLWRIRRCQEINSTLARGISARILAAARPIRADFLSSLRATHPSSPHTQTRILRPFSTRRLFYFFRTNTIIAPYRGPSSPLRLTHRFACVCVCAGCIHNYCPGAHIMQSAIITVTPFPSDRTSGPDPQSPRRKET